MNNKSILSSTPCKRFPQSRPSIRQSPHTLESNNYSDIKMESISEIGVKYRKSKSTRNSPKLHRQIASNSDDEDTNVSDEDTNVSDEESEEELIEEIVKDTSCKSDAKNERSSPVLKTNTRNVCVLSLSIFAILIGCVFGIIQLTSIQKSNLITIKAIKSQFPQQSVEFWLTIENGVDEAIHFHRPASFIFLYEQKTELLLENLLKSISSYILCKLSNCTETPIIVTDDELNQPRIVNNYGILIEKYRPLLEQKGLMIVKHLEKISGISAQIFHSMCDEYTPLVHKSLFIFTMEVDRMPANSERYLEEYFLNKWNVLKPDIFYALFTRITSMPLNIVS